jgi:hypothetical protein
MKKEGRIYKYSIFFSSKKTALATDTENLIINKIQLLIIHIPIRLIIRRKEYHIKLEYVVFIMVS